MTADYGANIVHVKSTGGGRSVAGNVGLAKATGKYLMFLDHDDLLFSDHVELLMERLFKKRNCAAAYALGWEIITDQEEPGGSYIELFHQMPKCHRLGYSIERLHEQNFIPIQCILFKRELYEKFGGFNEDLDYLEDWNLWVRYSKGGPFEFIPKLTSMYRTPANEKDRQARQEKLDAAYANVRALNEKQPLIKVSCVGRLTNVS